MYERRQPNGNIVRQPHRVYFTVKFEENGSDNALQP
jgi:hypothetical protein